MLPLVGVILISCSSDGSGTMSILSFEYLVFIAAVILIFYLLPKKARWVVLLAASLGFYLCSGWQGFVYLLAAAFITWLGGWRISKLQARMEAARADDDPATAFRLKRRMRRCLGCCLLLVLGAMAFIKYAGAGCSVVNGLLAALGESRRIGVGSILAPLGLSYFTFQCVGYLMDVYWKKTRAQQNFLKYLLFVSFFPQILQGPISTHNQLAPQLLAPKAFHPQRFTMGFLLMLWGYFKKMVLADRLAAVTLAVAEGSGQPGWLILLGVVLYTIRLYGDFSGGMDAVRGVALMLGVELTENFRRPFFSTSVAEYWRRWHISLGAWFRSYVFHPLSTSRLGVYMARAGQRLLGKKAGRMLPSAVSTFIIFFLIGVWHTANWNALIYGAYFGLLMGASVLLQPLFKALRKKLHIAEKAWWWRLIGWLRTMILVLIAQFFAFTAGPAQGISLLTGIFANWNFSAFPETMTGLMSWLEWGIAGGAMLIILLVDTLLECRIDVNARLARGPFLLRWPVMILLILAVLIFGCYGADFDAAAFLYTNF